MCEGVFSKHALAGKNKFKNYCKTCLSNTL